MANFVSPGVYVIEKDLSNYPTSINPSVVGIVGFANQGPTNKPTLITSQENLTQTFGNPTELITGQGLEGSIEILETTNSLYYIRAAGSDADSASGSVQLGSCPSLLVSSHWSSATGGGAEVASAGMTGGNSLYVDIQIAINGSNVFNTPKQFAIPAGTVGAGAASNKQALALKKIIGGSLDGANVGSFYDTTDLSSSWIAAGFAGSSVILYASSWSGAGRTDSDAVNILSVVDKDGNAGSVTSALTSYGISFDETGVSSVAYSVQSLYPGVGYNEGINSDGTTSGYSAQVLRTGGENANLQINRDGAAAESFKISLLDNGSFAESVINTGSVDNLKSQYIKGYFIAAGVDASVTKMANYQDKLSTFISSPTINGTDSAGAAQTNIQSRFNKPVEGTNSLAGGDNGTQGNTQLIGNVADKTGIYGLDDDTLNISMGAVPGITDDGVQDALITLAETSQNFLAVVSPPQGLTTVQQAIDWSNGQSDERTAAISSNFAAIYWPWVQTYDGFATVDRWYDPAVYAIRQMAYTDEVGDPWFAPAGVVRGSLTKPTDVEVSVNQGDRDSMYSGGNVVNPIVNFPQQGIMIFGQRTAQRDSTALDRVNVRRLLIQVRKILLASTRRFVFEPNDSVTWEKIEGVVDPLMDDIRRRRGLVDYAVICDETTNTPVRVDRNEMWCKVLIKPTKAAEVVVFELNLTSQSAQI